MNKIIGLDANLLYPVLPIYENGKEYTKKNMFDQIWDPCPDLHGSVEFRDDLILTEEEIKMLRKNMYEVWYPIWCDIEDDPKKHWKKQFELYKTAEEFLINYYRKENE